MKIKMKIYKLKKVKKRNKKEEAMMRNLRCPVLCLALEKEKRRKRKI